MVMVKGKEKEGKKYQTITGWFNQPAVLHNLYKHDDEEDDNDDDDGGDDDDDDDDDDDRGVTVLNR